MQAGKMEMETLGKILLLLAFLIIAITIISTIFKGCIGEERDKIYTNEAYWCWGTNLIRSEIPLFPTTCKPIIIEESAEKEDVSEIMKACWWMYGKNEWDLGVKEENFILGIIKGVSFMKNYVYTCYLFQPKEDIQLSSLRKYMVGNKEGRETAWGYIEGKGEGSNICFDEGDEGVLKKGRIYYVKFYDDRNYKGESYDKLIISSDNGFLEDKQRALIFLKWVGYKILDISGVAEIIGINLNPCYRFGQISEDDKIERAISRIAQKFRSYEEKEECTHEWIDLSEIKDKTVNLYQSGSNIIIGVSGKNIESREESIKGNLCNYQIVGETQTARNINRIEDLFNKEKGAYNIYVGPRQEIGLYKSKEGDICLAMLNGERYEKFEEMVSRRNKECVRAR